MCMELSTYPSRMRHQIRLKRKAWKSSLELKSVVDKYRTVKLLSDLLSQVKDEQTYIVVRERTHRNTAESTNARVKWWSVFQLGVLVGMCIFQVWWLKRFFEVSQYLEAKLLGAPTLTTKRCIQVKRVV
jgi:emp24/gp25L/p24 family/GOLD